MKLTLCFSALTFAVFASSSTIVKITVEDQPDYASLFDAFLTRHRPIDIESDSLGYEARLAIFRRTHQMIENHNRRYRAGLETFEMGINKFACMTVDEKRRYVSQIKPNEAFSIFTKRIAPTFDDSEVKDAESVDWRPKMQPIQDQDNCGSCYAFAAIATIEAQMSIKFNQSAKLSEQEAMECTNGCEGGLPQNVFRYSEKYNGCASASSYPYKGKVVHLCTTVHSNSRVENSKVESIYYTGNAEGSAKEAIRKFGPVVGAFEVYNSFMHYHSGVYHKTTADRQRLGYHAIALVGYGGGSDKYWIFRNSWGTKFGRSGYGYFARGINSCQIESFGQVAPNLRE